MAIWKYIPNVEELNQASAGSLAGELGIEFTEVGDDFVRGRMPVDARTRQPMGLLHGGASAALAETLGSVAGLLTLAQGQVCLGLEISVSHLRAVREGYVVGTARPVKLGRTVQVWEIRVLDELEHPVSIARLTLIVREGDDPAGSGLRKRLQPAEA
jgi:1,4-dihydroxy-2-naphthoyl-CoA hydrolase